LENWIWRLKLNINFKYIERKYVIISTTDLGYSFYFTEGQYFDISCKLDRQLGDVTFKLYL